MANYEEPHEYTELDAFMDALDEFEPVRVKLEQLWLFTRDSDFSLKDLQIVGASLAEIDTEIVRILKEYDLPDKNRVELVRHFVQKPDFTQDDLKTLSDQIAYAYMDLEKISKREGWFKEK